MAKTRELGSPCDLYMSLHKADGSQIAVARQERQTVLDAEIPEDGEYVLQVEDLLVGGSPGHVYRIDVERHVCRLLAACGANSVFFAARRNIRGESARAAARIQRPH